MKKFSVIILAAGQGTRMKSNLPKVLHKVGDKSMLQHLIDTCNQLNPHKIVVLVSHQAQLVEQSITRPVNSNLEFVLQGTEQGTAAASWYALSAFPQLDHKVIILYADSPLVQTESLIKLIESLDRGELSLFQTKVTNPFGLGRLIKEYDPQHEVIVKAIIEEKDATEQQKLIQDVFPGGMALELALLKQSQSLINNNNAQHEYYLTDLVKVVNQLGKKVIPVTIDPQEIYSANDRLQLAHLQKIYQQNLINNYLIQGLEIYDPSRCIVTADLSFGLDCVIEADVTLQGKVILGNNVIIKQGSIIQNCQIGDNTTIEAYSILESSNIGNKVTIGPFARLRPATVIADQAKVGNFVEMKNTIFGERSKANHLAYIGDATVGKNVNLGAGVITCNYDGYNKFKTIIADGAFIGSDSQLIAPVNIGEGVTVAAGTTVTQDVDQGLVLSRIAQINKPNWVNKSKLTQKK